MSFDTDCMSYPTDMNRSHYYMMMEQSYSPEFTAFPTGSPTYSVSSNSSASVMGSMRPTSFEEDYLTVKSEPDACGGAILTYNVLDSAESTGSCTRESLSPLPESPYDAYSHHFTTAGQPLLTPPASEDVSSSMGLKPIEPYMTFYPSDPFKYASPFDSNDNSMNPLCCSPSQQPITCYSQSCCCNMPMPTMMCQNNNMNTHTLPSYSSATSSPYYRPTRSPSSGRGIKSKQNVDKTLTDAQRRYKCTLCEKRFTRPSSLATHMHSHTGEKPYQCEVDGCGRRFSVVSNLRRHAKVHTHSI